MLKVSLPIKVGFLMTLAILLVLAAGYMTYNSLSSIVASIQVKSKPDYRLLTIREITSDLDKAENSVRMYTFTQNQRDIRPYYTMLSGIDDKIDALRSGSSSDSILLMQIDTISGLISEKMLIWNKMLDLYHSDSLDTYIRRLSAKVAVGTLDKKKSDKSILKRVFGRKAEKAEEAEEAEAQAAAQQEIILELNRIEQQDSLKNTRLQATESKMAATSFEIRDRLYLIISRMENEVIRSINENAKVADAMALKTYRRLALFAVLGTLLVILVLVVVIRYVKKTREYQKALEKSKEEAEQLARTKELFMANMSHEIRTPVNAIYGFTEQLLYEPLDDKSRKMLGIIKSSADHLSQIVNDILDFSKLQLAKIDLEKVHFHIQPLCEELQLLFQKRALEKNTRFHCAVSNSTPQVLLGDAYRLKQILLNLISNAVKFTSNGEISVMVDSKNMTGKTFQLILTVADTGIGISKVMQNKVFDDFTQAEVGTSRKYGGTGLGLSIVKKLVELHKGEIVLESHENVGTTITCVLPYEIGDREKLPATLVSMEVPDYIRSLTFLIVDDEEYNRLLFRTIFSRWHASFDEAENGSAAVEMIKSGKYDLVFMDARMPIMDGLEATKFIRGELGRSKDELPVIGISATHTSEDLKKYGLAGMNTFMPKPFTEKMLLETIIGVVKFPVGDQLIKIKKVAATGTAADRPTAGEPAGTSAIVNLNNLYHLANHDATFVKQLLITFIESTEQGLNSLHEAIDKADDKAISEIAHKISSPCRHIGADGLYANLKSIEELAQKPENIAILADLSEKSTLDFQQIKKELEKHLSQMDV